MKKYNEFIYMNMVTLFIFLLLFITYFYNFRIIFRLDLFRKTFRVGE
jgi:hypothetical protein